MAGNEIYESNPVLTGVFAHYCGPWEYEIFVKELFARRGYDMLIPDLPIGDPDATNDDYAAIVREAQRQKGAESYIDLGHSWGGDIIYRKLDAARVLMLIPLGSPLREVAKKAGIPKDVHAHSVLYSALAKAEESGDADFESERELIGRKLFGDLGDTALQGWATAKLRSHPHIPKNGGLGENTSLPDNIPVHYVGFKNDQVFFYRSQKKLVDRLKEKYPEVQLESSVIPTGHFPMLQQPELFVDHIITITERQKAKERLRAELDDKKTPHSAS